METALRSESWNQSESLVIRLLRSLDLHEEHEVHEEKEGRSIEKIRGIIGVSLPSSRGSPPRLRKLPKSHNRVTIVFARRGSLLQRLTASIVCFSINTVR